MTSGHPDPHSDASYRSHFDSADRAKAYDEQQYAAGSWSDLLWKIEKTQLLSIIRDLYGALDRIDYLDFASGTGRIIGFLEDKVDSATGIEISPAMVERARSRLRHGTVVCTDITDSTAPIEAQYDLITAYRFVLNAEPALRIKAMRALAARLRDGHSLLVFNNHGHIPSLKSFTHSRGHRRGRPEDWRPEGNVLPDSDVHELAHQAGLRIVQQHGYGVLSAKSLRLLREDRALRIEERLSRMPRLARFGINQLYVAQLDTN
ncbi:class I SAM-dependent DNA methyltransferase [Agromyces sp. MMS24-JH15]|uniref:class I SAM-dependent DNA methyltransferase n=1 Tax=Agromyces sp. MMS24-JH15 TaxID=3243765 RepID=UPI0037488D61